MGRCFALVTLYEPEAACVGNVRLIAEQADMVYLCDNSKEPHESDFSVRGNVKYLFFGGNRGLSAAFNSVFREFSDDFSEDDFVIFFDQDSTIDDGHISRLAARYEELEADGVPVGCLGPVYFNPYKNAVRLPRVKRRIRGGTYSVDSVITSSMMTRYRILKETGFWNEHVFLDMADWDICWRIKKRGYLCCSASDIVLTHRLGENARREGADEARRKRMFREYYQTREALYLLRQPYTPARFRLKFLRQLTVTALYRLISFPERGKRLEIYRRAASDYRAGRSGPYEGEGKWDRS